jgi:hypothetical protein
MHWGTAYFTTGTRLLASPRSVAASQPTTSRWLCTGCRCRRSRPPPSKSPMSRSASSIKAGQALREAAERQVSGPERAREIAGRTDGLWTLPWREMDSNHRYRRKRSASSWRRFAFAPILRCQRINQRWDEPLSKPRSCHAVPTVRIPLPPVKSHANHRFLPLAPVKERLSNESKGCQRSSLGRRHRSRIGPPRHLQIRQVAAPALSARSQATR